ncbi:DUF3267 domain-containing protein [Fundicoccus culcitae]|uniref:DUF3267 domain-containing protein n=1 Tax=Fundicoccus culcitae TaxID=2969821 RepID=A0ABY5P7N0_9LACT|nr:DUF3267 domain-containing protein [Fundicoccus culcitae]UUX34737.1 DUF3267 domain-containing protein [Fundicoccus culcitae]
MKLIKEVNLFENKRLLIGINVAAIVLMFIFMALFYGLGSQIAPDTETSINLFDIADNYFIPIVLFLLFYLLMIIVHELIHGLFFKLFAPNGKVFYGFKSGMAYATSPGNFYNKWQMFIIAIGPFAIISIVLTILFYIFNIEVYTYAAITGMHAGSCAGDFYYIYLIFTSPKGTQFEDTEVGINLYLPN